MAPQMPAAERSRTGNFQKDPLWKIKYVQWAVDYIRKDATSTDKKPGYIYATQEAKDGFVKIGFSQDTRAERPEALRKCRREFAQVYYTRKFNWAYKCEQIVHKLLFEVRHSLDDCECGTVKGHFEWFRVDLITAISAINLVMNWALQDPYETVSGDEFSAQLCHKWKDALKDFEASQKSPQPLRWPQFFGGDMQFPIDFSNLGHASNPLSPPQSSSSVYIIRYPSREATPVKRLYTSSRRHRKGASFSGRLPTQQLTPARSVETPSPTTRPSQLNRPQTVPAIKYSQLSSDSLDIPPSSDENLGTTTLSPDTRRMPSRSVVSGGFGAITSTESSSHLPSDGPRTPQPNETVPNARFLETNSQVAGRGCPTVKENFDRDRRESVKTEDNIETVDFSVALALVSGSDDVSTRPMSNDVHKTTVQSEYDYETVHSTDDEIEGTESRHNTKLKRPNHQYNGRHISEISIGHSDTGHKGGSAEATEHAQPSECKADAASFPLNSEAHEDDIPESRASFHSAPSSPTKGYIPDPLLLELILKREIDSADQSPSLELEKAPATVRSSTASRQRSPTRKLGSPLPDDSEGLQRSQAEIEADQTASSTSLLHAELPLTTFGEEEEKSTGASRISVLGSTDLENDSLVRRFKALRIDNKNDCHEANLGEPTGVKTSTRASKENRFHSEDAVSSGPTEMTFEPKTRKIRPYSPPEPEARVGNTSSLFRNMGQKEPISLSPIPSSMEVSPTKRVLFDAGSAVGSAALDPGASRGPAESAASPVRATRPIRVPAGDCMSGQWLFQSDGRNSEPANPLSSLKSDYAFSFTARVSNKGDAVFEKTFHGTDGFSYY